MNAVDIVLIVLTAAALIFAVLHCIRKKGRCSCGCEGCTYKCKGKG